MQGTCEDPGDDVSSLPTNSIFRYGKMVIHNKGEYHDVESILAMSTEYFTEEAFTPHEYEFRVQCIGPHVRSFRRNSDSSWKNNWGNVRFADHPWDAKYSVWVDAVREIFGGLDMFALDVLHTKVLSADLRELYSGLCKDQLTYIQSGGAGLYHRNQRLCHGP